uniref:Cyclin C-terminal domain-containing protein n=1 Tax=Tetraselmis chuii TaxID=63592 RepID=A0A7S1SJL1_9CHLO
MVSVCIHQHDVQRALKLVSDMKQRGVECSVHTYTALMNVCIKCGKGPLALDAYKMMLTDGLQPNVITYNTLVDVYGKMGAWQQALGVLQVMRERCVAPVLRTYNTVMIACNICSQPREALALYEKMKSEGFCPNATTYNTLITAFGKVGQLERAMDAFQEMRNKGYPRSVVTYSTLISACERVGQWRKALDLFAEMRPDGCAPNTVTYNSLIKACSQGAQWEKALELFESMGNEGCRPDVVTFTALINACDKSGQWRTALAMFERMRACGCKPDSIVYNAVIDCLWETGVASAQCQALGLFKRAQKEGHFGQRGLDILEAPGGGALGQRLEVNLHAQTAGVAMLGLYCWLVALFRHVSRHGGALLPAVVNIITDSGRDAREMANNVVKGAVACMMPAWGAPFRPAADSSHSRVLEATGGAVTEWLLSAAFEGQLCIFFPCAAADEECRSASHSLRQMTTPPKADATEARCTEAFAAIKRFEQTHALSLQAMGVSYLEARPEVVSFALALGTQLQLSLEVVHDAVLLMDRLASTGAALQPDQLFVMMASCVKVAVEKTSGQDARFFADLELASGMLASALVNGEHDLHAALDNDTAAISSLRCLQVYLERMGCEFKDLGPLESMVKLPTRLTTESLTDTTFLNCRPSVVAAAILCSVRRCRGIVPYWPSVLSKMTGYRDMNSPELAVAVKAAQRLYKEWAGQNHVPLMFDRSDSSSSTQCGLGGSRGGSPRGGSPIMWGVASPLGTSPTSYGNGGSFNKLPLGGGARELTLGASYASSESSQSANGISPSQSPPGTSPRGEHLSELNLAALSLGGM